MTPPGYFRILAEETGWSRFHWPGITSEQVQWID